MAKETEFLIVTLRAVKSYPVEVGDSIETEYTTVQLLKNKDLEVIRSMGFEVEVEDEQ